MPLVGCFCPHLRRKGNTDGDFVYLSDNETGASLANSARGVRGQICRQKGMVSDLAFLFIGFGH